MTTTLEIITAAMRESNLIAIGVTPTVPQQNEGLLRLQALVSSVVGNQVGEKLQDWPIGLTGVNMSWPNGYQWWTSTEWRYPKKNSRLLLNADGPQTVYMPQEPDNGSRIAVVPVNQDLATMPVTLDGNGKLIAGAASVVLNNNATAARVYIYQAETANWIQRIDLALVDPFYFPNDFDDYFITKLAMRLNPRYGRAVQAESAARFAEQERQIRAYYRQKQNMPADPAVLRTSDPGRFGNGFWWGGGRRSWMG